MFFNKNKIVYKIKKEVLLDCIKQIIEIEPNYNDLSDYNIGKCKMWEECIDAIQDIIKRENIKTRA